MDTNDSRVAWRAGLLGAALLATVAPLRADATQASPSASSAPSSISADALRAATSDPAARAFYQKNGWKPVWTNAAAKALDTALQDRKQNGLDRVSFLPDVGSTASLAKEEVARTQAALRYASALAKGIVDPAKLHEVYTIPRPDPDLFGALASAIEQDRLAKWFASLPPQDGDYDKLSKAYLQYASDTGSGADRISDKGLIHVGDDDPRVPAIAKQLRQGEYLPAQDGSPQSGAGEGSKQNGADASQAAEASGNAPDDPNRYTQNIADAIKHLQRDYGIAEDGIVGADTLKVLNLRPGDRARSLAVALERLRWLPREAPATRIDVNTATARLEYFRDGALADDRKVIVGQPGKETPPLLAPIYRLVANPTWTIPKSIENSELSNVSARYLRDHNMERRNGYIVQQPGPNNALGLVKFDMQDDQAIYLHDTSSPSLFDRSQRHLSHGCVRVSDALGFAQMLAKDEGVTDAWNKAHVSSDQTFVALPKPIPVRLLYHNVFVDQNGEVAFRTDPYGWNPPVAKALGFGNVSGTQAHADPIDIGP